MAIPGFLIAACLDPVQAAMVLALILAYRGSQPIVVAAAAAALASETIMVLAAYDYAWGELIAQRFLAALVQAAVLIWTVRIVRSAARSGLAWLDSGRLSGSGTTTLGSLGAGSTARRLAPWHVRAYVRCRIERLRRR